MTDRQIQPDGADNSESLSRKYFKAELLDVPVQARTLLENYSKIPPNEVLQYVIQVVSHWVSYSEILLYLLTRLVYREIGRGKQ
jgi:hypothetical protein